MAIPKRDVDGGLQDHAHNHAAPRRNALRVAAVFVVLPVVLTASVGFWRSCDAATLGKSEGVWHQLRSLLNVLLLIPEFLCFLGPGAAALLLLRRYRVAPVNFVMTCVSATAVISYVTFWVCFLDYRLGRCLSILITLL